VDVLIALKGFVFPSHFWTLAVEEHFYLVWPVLVYRLSRRTLQSISVSLFVAALALRVALVIRDVAPAAIYVLTPCRMDALALGAFLALTVRCPDGWRTPVRVARLALPALALIWFTLMYSQGGWSQYGHIPQTVGYLVTELFYGSVLVVTLSSERLAAVVSARALQFLGKYSYSLYIFHVFVILLAAPFFALGDASHYSIVFSRVARLGGGLPVPGALMLFLDGLAFIVLSIGISIGMALLSWHLLELPFLRLKRFFPYATKNAAENVLEASQAFEA
jgi:peptidoglycan/LPS O-acetylase OafA/YrhL